MHIPATLHHLEKSLI